MKNSNERLDFIASYISAYKEKIELLNSEGLFDSAKLFELFAIEACSLYFNQRFINLNTDKFNYPYVDLVSADKQMYLQVSTTKEIPTKIKATLEKIRDCGREEFKEVKTVKFFVLSNDSIAKVKDYEGKNQIGNISFNKNTDLITTQTILQRAENDLDFQIALYKLLIKDVESIKDNISKLREAIAYSKAIGLHNIDCKINNEYEIDRTEIIAKIKADKYKNISIQGGAGSGKSVICKKLVENEDIVVYARAERFSEETDINNIWGFNVKQTLESLNGKPIIFFIDSLEFIADNPTKLDLLNILYESAKGHEGVQIVTSCRTSDKNSFLKIEANYNVYTYEVPDLTTEELQSISKKYSIIKKMADLMAYTELLKSPLYINLIVTKVKDINDIDDENKLREYIWQHIICLNDSQVTEIVKSIVFNRAKNFSVGVSIDLVDGKVLKKLISKGVLVKNKKTVRLKYDVFEDICFEQFFDEQFDECKGKYNRFFEIIETLGRCAYRRYQIWIENKLLAKNNRERFLYELVSSAKMPLFWKKQTEIGLVKSRHCEMFFKEYGSTLIKNNCINDFINTINLYAFEIRNDALIYSQIMLRPSGVGRRSLIHLVAENKLYKDFKSDANSLIKLCKDYSLETAKDGQTANQACEILIFFLEKTINKTPREQFYELKDFVNTMLAPIYCMAEYANEWIKVFWKKLTELYKSGIRDDEILAENIIDFTLKPQHIALVKYIPMELCELAETYWTYSPLKNRKKEWEFYSDDLDKEFFKYGLSEKANYEYNHSNTNAQNSSFFYCLFKFNFWQGLDWTIQFVNKCISSLSKNKDETLSKYDIYFVDEETHRSYIGFEGMWLVTTQEHVLPLVIADLIYCLKEELRYVIKNDRVKNKETIKFANEVKKKIYEQSNNIALLTIIADVGMEFDEKLPGYALDLSSNVDIILNDLSRYAQTLDNPIKDILEKQILQIVGIPFPMPDRFGRKKAKRYNLRQYVADLQLNVCEELKNKCYKILDYLYKIIPNNKENAEAFLQIQSMDLRTAKEVKINDKYSVLIPTVSGEAEKVTKKLEKASLPQQKINKLINDFSQKLVENNYELEDCLKLIKIIIKEVNKNPVPTMYERFLVMLISIVFQKTDLEVRDREQLCKIWIAGIRKYFTMGSFTFDIDLSLALFRQIESNINNNIKNEIKQLILELIMYKDPHGIIKGIARIAKNYMSTNKTLANAMFNTIVKIAEDEMSHQRYNAHYLKTHKKHFNDEIEFVPNAQSKLKGVDYYIEKNNDEPYHSKYKEIVEGYLYLQHELDLSEFDMNNYDITTMCYALNCQLTLEDSGFANVVKKFIVYMIDILKITEYTSHHNDILGVYETYEVQEFLQRELVCGKNRTSMVLNILFDGIDFSKFTRKTIKLYQETFGVLLSCYFDSYNNQERREECEEIICELENKILMVTEEEVKKELFKSLILSCTYYGATGNWSKCSAHYSYKDKQFLNKMFSTYGKYHLKELLDVIFKLHIDKLLPEILLSLRDVFLQVKNDKGLEERNNSFFNVVQEQKFILINLITEAFLNFNEEIKQDEDLIKAFEDVLEMLIELNYEEAATILDEFRVH